ncbi:MAG: hypothetical protein MUD12_13125 [Spirochaetes bacterium]|jgi:ELWxxDGT repeat protein|nr:hypothetical protein [Spirochaetota bacterium]
MKNSSFVIIVALIICLNSGCNRAGNHKTNPLLTVPFVTQSTSRPGSFCEFNGKLYFAADDGVNGRELWCVDGTNPPALAYDLDTDPAVYDEDGRASSGTSDAYSLTVHDGKLYFFSKGDLYSFDGSSIPVAGLSMEAMDAGRPEKLYSFGGSLYFFTEKSEGSCSFWRYDCVNPPVLLTVFTRTNGERPCLPDWIMDHNGRLYFDMDDGAHGREPWMCDGVNPPSMVADMVPGAAGSRPAKPASFGGKLYFGCLPGSRTQAPYLYEYDGVNPPAAVYPAGGYMYPESAAVFNGRLYFSASDAAHGREIWSFDGTNPPAMAFDLVPGVKGSEPGPLFSTGSRLYFRANSRAYDDDYCWTHDNYLWLYDGTNPPAIAYNKQTSAVFHEYGGRVFFARDRDGYYGSDYEPAEFNEASGMITEYDINNRIFTRYFMPFTM